MANDPSLSALMATACGAWQPPCSPASPGMVLQNRGVVTSSGGMNLGGSSSGQWLHELCTVSYEVDNSAKERLGCSWK